MAGWWAFAAPRPGRFVNRPYSDVGGMPVGIAGPAGRRACAVPRPGCPQGTPLRWFWWVVGYQWALLGRPALAGDRTWRYGVFWCVSNRMAAIRRAVSAKCWTSSGLRGRRRMVRSR